MLNRFLPILIFNLVALSGNSAEVCGTLTECRNLKKQLSTTLVAVNEKIQELQPSLQACSTVRDEKGYPRELNFSSVYLWKHFDEKVEIGALEYCASQGKNLPTIREFAQLASRRCTPKIIDKEPCGAAGISETAKYEYQEVNVKNPDGTTDHFYYSNEGYQRPYKWEKPNFWISAYWSSSMKDVYKNFIFDSETGGINAIYPKYDVGAYAICVPCPN